MTRKPAELKDEEIKAAVQDGLSKAVASMYTITPELIDAYERRAIATAATRKALEHATKLNGNRATLMTTEEHAADEWGRGSGNPATKDWTSATLERGAILRFYSESGMRVRCPSTTPKPLLW